MLGRFSHRFVLFSLLPVLGCGKPSPDPAATLPPAVQPVAKTEAPTAPPESPGDGLVADDGRTLWASPTAGEPIDLSLVPSESGLFVHARPSALLASDEGRRVWRALGPALGDALPEEPEAIGVLTVGVGPGESYESVATTVAIDPEPSDDLPLVPREFEQLVETTDGQRHLTMVFSPRFLLGDGGSLLRGAWAPLRELLLAQARDEWAAAALSLHIDDAGRLYWELRVVANASEPEVRTAAAVAKRAQGWSADLGAVVGGRDWSPYSREVVERSPRMLAVVGKYARRGVDGRQAVVNGYAPAESPHQLVLAAERLVAELASPVARPPVATAAPSLVDLPIAERLRAPVTIQFRRESLETAVGILSDTLATPIEIRGRDLQLEGITRNQMLALDVTELPAADVLVQVLRKANPDPLAEGPADPRQRLVYVVGAEGITITTRAAAERRGDVLPEFFQPE